MDPFYRSYVTVAFFTGMRAGEINGLTWNDYKPDMEHGPQLSINKAYVYGQDGTTKTKKSKRMITCLPDVVSALNSQRRLTGLLTHIFLTKDGARMTPDYFRNVVWIPALNKAGVTYRAPIQTRHSFATMMLSAGEDVGWAQNMLGHSSLQMIFQRYYAWIPHTTRSDGLAFKKYVEKVHVRCDDKGCVDGVLPIKKRKKYPNLVPLDDYRQKKELPKIDNSLILFEKKW